MPRLVLISDTHDLHEHVPLPEGDVLVHAGDFTSSGTRGPTRRFLAWFAAQTQFRARVLIAGHHDRLFERHPSLARSFVPPNVTYLQDAAASVVGLRFWGSPVTPTFLDWAFNREAWQIGAHWNRIPEGLDVLVTHGPPRGILDQLEQDGALVGCPVLRDRVRAVRPRLHVFGHIHARRGQRHEDGTHFVNASICGEAYEVTNTPIVVDLEPRSTRDSISVGIGDLRSDVTDPA